MRIILILFIVILSEYHLLVESSPELGIIEKITAQEEINITTALLVAYAFITFFLGTKLTSSMADLAISSIIIILDPTNTTLLLLMILPITRFVMLNVQSYILYIPTLVFGLISFITIDNKVLAAIITLSIWLVIFSGNMSKKLLFSLEGQVDDYLEVLEEIRIRSDKYETQANISSNLFTYKKELDQTKNELELLKALVKASKHIYNADMAVLYIFKNGAYELYESDGSSGMFDKRTALSLEEGSCSEIDDHYIKVPFHYENEPFACVIVFGKKSVIASNNEPVSVIFENSDIENLILLRDTISYRLSEFKIRNKLEYTAYQDRLTTLPNRINLESRLFPKKLKESKVTGQNLYAIMIDIDDFKGVNDVFGHDVGDNVLRGVAITLRQTIKEERNDKDIISRWGGEEFAGLILGTEEEAKLAAESYRISVENFDFPQRPITVSVGVAEVNPELEQDPEKDSLDVALKMADMALYEAKRTGKNKVIFYDTGLEGE